MAGEVVRTKNFVAEAAKLEHLRYRHLIWKSPDMYARRILVGQDRHSLRHQLRLLEAEPLATDGFEGIRVRRPFRLPLRARVHFVSDQLPRVIALLASTLQRHIGVLPQRQQLLHPVDTVLKPPKPTPRRRDEDVPPCVLSFQVTKPSASTQLFAGI